MQRRSRAAGIAVDVRREPAGKGRAAPRAGRRQPRRRRIGYSCRLGEHRAAMVSGHSDPASTQSGWSSHSDGHQQIPVAAVLVVVAGQHGRFQLVDSAQRDRFRCEGFQSVKQVLRVVRHIERVPVE